MKNIEELKADLIQNYRDVNKINEELCDANDKIIQHQKEHIDLLENHIVELTQIIEKYLLKSTSNDSN